MTEPQTRTKANSGADADQFAEHLYRHQRGGDGDNKADERLAEVGCLEPRVNPRKQPGQQAVIGHRVENAALPVQQDQDHGGQPG